MADEWITVKEAAELLNVSDRYVRNLAAKGKLDARRDGNRWLIHSSLSEPKTEHLGIPAEQSAIPTEQHTIGWLQERIEGQAKQISELQSELASARKETAEASQRHDTIVLQLTRQLEQSQRLIEYRNEPWYRRWFRSRKAEQD